MRTLPAFVVCLTALAACGAPSSDSAPPQATIQKAASGVAWTGNAEQDGITASCIGATLEECGTRVEWALRLRRGSLAWSIPQPRIDVNGRSINPYSPSLTAELKLTGKPLRINAELNSGDRIKGLIIHLPQSPISLGATTQDDYNRTGVFEAFAIAGNRECSEQERLILFQYLENRVKPQVVHGPREYSRTSMHPTDFSYHSYTPTLKYCGRTFKIQQLIMSSMDSVTLDNRMGMSSSNWIYLQ